MSFLNKNITIISQNKKVTKPIYRTYNIKEKKIMISPFYQSRKRGVRIHILKTNIKSKPAINTLKLLFNTHPDIIRWSIDLEDIDKVLRVETNNMLSQEDIINQVTARGFYCEELV